MTLSHWHFTQGHTSILVHFQEPLLRSIILQVNSWGTPHHIFLPQVTNKHTPSLGCSTKVLNAVDPAYLPLQLIPISAHTSHDNHPGLLSVPQRVKLPPWDLCCSFSPRHFPMSPALTLFTHTGTCTHAQTLLTPSPAFSYQLNVIYSK